jgi:ABC-type phosphate transport system substrate-binding protein
MFIPQPAPNSKQTATRRRFAVLLALLFLGSSSVFAADYQVIVHPTNANDSLTRDQVERMFLKRLVKWEGGAIVSPVDQARDSGARAAFTKGVHRKTVGAVVSYWQQQIFAGRGIPPAEMANDAAVLAFVAANPGAIGYITGTATATGVKVVAIR